ncbi:dihydrolipoamide dehydrogenase [Aerococcus kribbianus]|uniref:Dihydrolipoamide dehydrogenase n=1 Tax=Aerococcus kribbianus TaxID=2999064 RepID=A0A9X3JD01_9LACT|nr:MULTISPECIES: dihydrolipoamide dehydrogenase [unclassified Aerococcus]MCZ0716990.1 dihydrolipoamide dehydrogenase [Aerococcus sp. YH-aer221]MCZ0725278.1 dihydrolipoamide dehydrogenase [Aerococcus sp. YH-aer222]
MKTQLQWRGEAGSHYRPYAQWKNNGPVGVCGTYCAAVLVHDRVYKDTGAKLDQQLLINGLLKPIDKLTLHPGSFFWNIQFALNYMLANVGYYAQSGLFTEKAVPKLIDQGKGPVIVGTLSLLGSPYKNHWLLVYAYAYDQAGDLYFRAYDNHGKSQAIIPAKETFSYVYVLPYPDKDIAEKKPTTVLSHESDLVFVTNPKH